MTLPHKPQNIRDICRDENVEQKQIKTADSEIDARAQKAERTECEHEIFPEDEGFFERDIKRGLPGLVKTLFKPVRLIVRAEIIV